ncbi:flippase-like domain-containing protein [Candidatus Woesearchaeota archaeon]|nr:flippase-like domain-containing protein [Candidatus Woesearchaeota archaeon]
MKPSIKHLITTTILFAIILLLFNYLKNNLSDFKQLTLVNPLYLFVLVLIFMAGMILNGFLLDYLMRPFGLRLNLKEIIGLPIITNFYNLITPFRGGAGIRAVYLNKKHNFPYVHFLATLGAIYVILFLVNGLGGILSMIYIWLSYNIFNWIIFLAFTVFTLFLIVIIILSPKLPKSKNSLINKFIKVINGWHLIKDNKQVLFITTIIGLVQLILGAINTMITYNLFSIQIDFFKALFIASVGSLSILVAITPGNLGVGEAISIFSANLIGIPLTEAIAATILLRAINLAVILILGPIFSYILIKHEK